jgi:hypothetical protein
MANRKRETSNYSYLGDIFTTFSALVFKLDFLFRFWNFRTNWKIVSTSNDIYGGGGPASTSCPDGGTGTAFVYQLENFDLLLRICCLMCQMLDFFFNCPYSDSTNMNHPFVVLEFFLCWLIEVY